MDHTHIITIKKMYYTRLVSNNHGIDYIGLSIAQNTGQFRIIDPQQHWYFLRHIGFMQIYEHCCMMTVFSLT